MKKIVLESPGEKEILFSDINCDNFVVRVTNDGRIALSDEADPDYFAWKFLDCPGSPGGTSFETSIMAYELKYLLEKGNDTLYYFNSPEEFNKFLIGCLK